jgi:hypothetical protein
MRGDPQHGRSTGSNSATGSVPFKASCSQA